jgi:hypothetical protein
MLGRQSCPATADEPSGRGLGRIPRDSLDTGKVTVMKITTRKVEKPKTNMSVMYCYKGKKL